MKGSQWAKGSLASTVEEPHHARWQKKPGKASGSPRNETVRGEPFAKEAAYPKSHSRLRPKLVEKVSYDVYIPKNITVANLARLLKVKHSM